MFHCSTTDAAALGLTRPFSQEAYIVIQFAYPISSERVARLRGPSQLYGSVSSLSSVKGLAPCISPYVDLASRVTSISQ